MVSWSRRQVTSRSEAVAAEKKSGATCAPAAASGSALEPVLFHTVVPMPAARNARASADPIGPRPITETVAPAGAEEGDFVMGSACYGTPYRESTHFYVRYLPPGYPTPSGP